MKNRNRSDKDTLYDHTLVYMYNNIFIYAHKSVFTSCVRHGLDNTILYTILTNG